MHGEAKGVVSSILVSVVLMAFLAVAAPALAYVNWPGYLFDLGHSSLNGAATTITPGNAGSLAPAWSSAFTPPAKLGSGGFDATPVVYDGYIYIGGNNGTFYQLDEATGAVVHSVFLGEEAACNQTSTPFSYGVVDTATVAPDPSRGGAPTALRHRWRRDERRWRDLPTGRAGRQHTAAGRGRGRPIP